MRNAHGGVCSSFCFLFFLPSCEFAAAAARGARGHGVALIQLVQEEQGKLSSGKSCARGSCRGRNRRCPHLVSRSWLLDLTLAPHRGGRWSGGSAGGAGHWHRSFRVWHGRDRAAAPPRVPLGSKGGVGRCLTSRAQRGERELGFGKGLSGQNCCTLKSCGRVLASAREAAMAAPRAAVRGWRAAACSRAALVRGSLSRYLRGR